MKEFLCNIKPAKSVLARGVETHPAFGMHCEMGTKRSATAIKRGGRCKQKKTNKARKESASILKRKIQKHTCLTYECSPSENVANVLWVYFLLQIGHLRFYLAVGKKQFIFIEVVRKRVWSGLVLVFGIVRFRDCPFKAHFNLQNNVKLK